jgi:hypothetical protein
MCLEADMESSQFDIRPNFSGTGCMLLFFFFKIVKHPILAFSIEEILIFQNSERHKYL